jgi:cell division protein FtsI/penicillin-binding protein 2
MQPLLFLLHRLFQALKRYLGTFERTQYLKLAFFLFGLLIVWTTFKYTVLEFSYYRSLADAQQTITVKNPVSRGTIYSNNEPPGVFATSTDLPDLAVDPQAKGDRAALIQFVSDVVFYEYCGRTTIPSERCIDQVLTYIRESRDEQAQYSNENLRNALK